MLGLNFGICIPKSCKPEKIERLMKRLQKLILRNKIVLSIVPETCQVKEDMGWNLEAADYICL